MAKRAEVAVEAGQRVEVRGVWYGQRAELLAALDDTLLACGCWLHERSAGVGLVMEFEVQLRSVVELYGELLATGLEMSRESQAAMAELCMLRRHLGREPMGVRLGLRRGRWRLVTVRLEVRFADEMEAEMATLVAGLA